MYFLFPGCTPEQLIPSSTQLQLFITLKDAVTKDLQHKIALEETPRKSNRRKKAKASHVKTPTNTPDENPYANLCKLEEQDSQDDDK